MSDMAAGSGRANAVVSTTPPNRGDGTGRHSGHHSVDSQPVTRGATKKFFFFSSLNGYDNCVNFPSLSIAQCAGGETSAQVESRAHAGKEGKFNGRLAPGLHGMALDKIVLQTQMFTPAGPLIPANLNDQQLVVPADALEGVKTLVDRIDEHASKRTREDAYEALRTVMFMLNNGRRGADPSDAAHMPVLVLVEQDVEITSGSLGSGKDPAETHSKEKQRNWMPALVNERSLCGDLASGGPSKAGIVPHKIHAFWPDTCVVDPAFSKGLFAPTNIVPLDLTNPPSMLLWTFMTALMPESDSPTGTRSAAEAISIIGARGQAAEKMTELEDVGSEVQVQRLLELYVYGPAENMLGSNEETALHLAVPSSIFLSSFFPEVKQLFPPVIYGAAGVIIVPAHDCARCLWGAAECQSLCAPPFVPPRPFVPPQVSLLECLLQEQLMLAAILWASCAKRINPGAWGT